MDTFVIGACSFSAPMLQMSMAILQGPRKDDTETRSCGSTNWNDTDCIYPVRLGHYSQLMSTFVYTDLINY